MAILERPVGDPKMVLDMKCARLHCGATGARLRAEFVSARCAGLGVDTNVVHWTLVMLPSTNSLVDFC